MKSQHYDSKHISMRSLFHNFLLWSIVITFLSPYSLAVCPKTNSVRKTPRFGKRSADFDDNAINNDSNNKINPIECLELKSRLMNELLPAAKMVHSSETSKTNYELIDSMTGRLLSSKSMHPSMLENGNIMGIIFTQPNQIEKYFLSILNKRASESLSKLAPLMDEDQTKFTPKSLDNDKIDDSNEDLSKNGTNLSERQLNILRRLFLSYLAKSIHQQQRKQSDQ